MEKPWPRLKANGQHAARAAKNDVDMMAKQGVSMGMNADGGTTVKIRMTKEMVDRTTANHQQQGDWEHTIPHGQHPEIPVCLHPPPSSGGRTGNVSNGLMLMP